MNTWAKVGVAVAILGGLLWGANTLHNKIDAGGYNRANGEWLARNAEDARLRKEAEERDRVAKAKKDAEAATAAADTRKKMRKLEKENVRLEQQYENYLARETTDSECQLDPDGVRLWNAANRGSLQEGSDSDRPGPVELGSGMPAGAPTIEVRLREASGWQPSYFSESVSTVP